MGYIARSISLDYEVHDLWALAIAIDCTMAKIQGLKSVAWLSRQKTLVKFSSMTLKDDKG